METQASVLFPQAESSLMYYYTGAEKLCQSGWIDTDTGKCSEGRRSLNRGKPCNSVFDCPTNTPGQYALCRCGLSKSASKYCDIEGGDDEWIKARNAVFFIINLYLLV